MITMKIIRREMERIKGDYETISSRNEHSRRPDFLCALEFAQQLQKELTEDRSKGKESYHSHHEAIL